MQRTAQIPVSTLPLQIYFYLHNLEILLSSLSLRFDFGDPDDHIAAVIEIFGKDGQPVSLVRKRQLFFVVLVAYFFYPYRKAFECERFTPSVFLDYVFVSVYAQSEYRRDISPHPVL